MKRLHVAAALFASALAASAAFAAPTLGSGRYPNGTSAVPALTHAHGVLPRGALPQGSDVLYDQYDNDSGRAPVSQDFEAGYEAYDNAGADDFVVPAGGWTITGIDAQGQYFSPPSSGQLGPANSFEVTFYADAGGMPGAAVATLLDQAYVDATGSGVPSITLDPPVQLDAGTYWVSIVARLDILVGGEWGWETRTVQTNEKAVWENPGNGFATNCTTWHVVGQCVPMSGGPDYMFRLHGAAGGGGATDPVANVTPASLSLTVDADLSITAPLRIANVGGGSLTWSLAEAAVKARPMGSSKVLYDQYDNDANQTRPPPSQDFGAGFEAYTNAAADDFVIPAGGWTITRVDAQGKYYSGQTLGPADSFTVTFYADDAGAPGAVVAASPGQSYADTGAGSPSIVLSAPVQLGAGVYWISIVAKMDISHGFWGWENRTVQANAGGMWENPGSGLVQGCATWTVLTTCFPTVPGPDFMFRLYGTAAGSGSACANPSDVPWLSVSPTSGSVWGGGSWQESTVTVSPSAASLEPGNYSALVCVATNDPVHALVAVLVSMTVTPAGTSDPVASIAPTSLNATVGTGSTTTTPLHIANTGGGTLTWSLTEATTSTPPMGSTVLYDQNNSDANQQTLSQDWEDTYVNRDTLGADDFVVPAGGWTITGVDITGGYWNGAGPAESFNVAFYADANGLPGAPVATLPTQAYMDPTGFGSASITLNSPVALMPGKYWLSVQARMDFYPYGQWGWENRTIQTGSMSAFENPGDGWGTGCATWGPKLTCVPSAAGPDFMFRLNGTSSGGGGGCENPSNVPWLSVNPTSGSVDAGATEDSTVTVDPAAAGLTAGDYSAQICVSTNDPAHTVVSVPVSVTVIAEINDGIFCSGFEDGEDGSCSAGGG